MIKYRRLKKCEINCTLNNAKMCKLLTQNKCCTDFVPLSMDVDFTSCDNVNIVLRDVNPCLGRTLTNGYVTLEIDEKTAHNKARTVFVTAYVICIKGKPCCGNQKYILRATCITGKEYNLCLPCPCYSPRSADGNEDDNSSSPCYNNGNL